MISYCWPPMDYRGFFIFYLTIVAKYVIMISSEEKMRILLGIVLFAIAQVMAWFQSNSGILSEPFKSNYVWIALVFGPMVSLMFSFATIQLYEHMELWSIRFLTFGIGYLVFIPLTWYFLGEEIITVKNVISFCLCLTLISIQFLMK